jgi:hypothetical protein
LKWKSVASSHIDSIFRRVAWFGIWLKLKLGSMIAGPHTLRAVPELHQHLTSVVAGRGLRNLPWNSCQLTRYRSYRSPPGHCPGGENHENSVEKVGFGGGDVLS